jgi:DNA-binding CsgD family transcriptional regulator
MNIFQHLLQSAQIEVESMEIEHVDGFICHSYIKSMEGEYLSCNKNQALSFGFSKEKEVTGITDHDVLTENEASIIRSNDVAVLSNGKPLIFTEVYTSHAGKIVTGTSMKSVLKNKMNKVIGMIGLSILHGTENDDPLENEYHLSKRHLECLYYLVKGFSVKQISNALGLSSRTVEHYIEAIKLKLNCSRRSDIISKAILLPEIKRKLLGYLNPY